MRIRTIATPLVVCLCMIAVFYVATTMAAHAQGQPGQQTFVSLSKIEQQSQKTSGMFADRDLPTFINRIFFFLITLGAMLAVGRLAYAGWLYMLGDNYGNLSKAKTIIGNVVIGLLLLLSIWLILNLINPQILNLDVLQSIK
ncbi:hypothetical protein FJY93_00255 [Candidatus Kaiserbacteria bacterium]|nr:hypothetical protein [Candidatus Kaiserbacteria bacterium]